MDEVVAHMKQHYTQSKQCRNLSLPAITKLTEEQAFQLLVQVRFADSGGVPYCPTCFEKQRIRWRNDKRWFCTPCRKTFSVTSNTVWARNHRSMSTLLIMLANFVLSSFGESNIQLARRCDADPKAVYVFLMKVREAMHLDMTQTVLSGDVELDACWIGGYKRKLNDRRLEQELKRKKQWKLPPKKALCGVRERSGPVLVQICNGEPDFADFVRTHVRPGSRVFTDRATTWEKLGDTYTVRSVSHSDFYWTPEASTQHIEVFFRRFRRAENLHGHVSGDYLDLYAAELAFRETYCRHSDAERFLKLIALCFRHPISKRFSGYLSKAQA